jgi:PiT family inorganic phosphate transporter
VVSPLSGGIIAFAVFSLVNKYLFRGRSPLKNSLIMAPIMAGLLALIIGLSVFYKGLAKLYLDLPLSEAVLLSLAAAAAAGLGTRLYLSHLWGDCRGFGLERQISQVDGVFAVMQVATACYVAFAHGANDVANAVGPMAGAYATIMEHSVVTKAPVPTFILAMGAGGIVLGLMTYGARVMSTIGGKITEITPSRGFAAEFACATTVLVCSRLGLPISTTHTLVGSVIGVGVARGVASLDRKIIMKIAFSWLIEIPLAATITVITFKLLQLI